MTTSPGPTPALMAALAQLLRPLVRLLLRHGVPWNAFEDVAKQLYAEVAYEDFALAGRKPSVSRAAILSGLTRKEAQRLLAGPGPAREGAPEATTERYNRASRVLTAWLRDPDFCDRRGRPRSLAVDSPTGFAGLVRRHSGDMPVRAVLDELLRVGAVVQTAEGRIEQVTRAYVPQASLDEKLAILGSDVADLVATIDHNLQHGEHDPRFQRKVMYHRIPAGALAEFRQVSAGHAQALLEKLDLWLAAHDVSGPPGSPHARVGVGIHYFEAPARGADDPGDTT